jgi:hypothetical protein
MHDGESSYNSKGKDCRPRNWSCRLGFSHTISTGYLVPSNYASDTPDETTVRSWFDQGRNTWPNVVEGVDSSVVSLHDDMTKVLMTACRWIV